MILRRNTFNYNLAKINSTESSLNNERLNNNNDNIKNSKNEEKTIIEEEPINISRNLSNNNNADNSLLSIKEEYLNEQNDVNQNSIILDNNNEKENKKNNNNQFIIKEEEENILSDNSFKNIETISDIKKKPIEKIILGEDIINNKEKNNNNNVILKVNNGKENLNTNNSENKKQLILKENNLDKNIKIFSDIKKENKDKYNKLIKNNNDKLIKFLDESKNIQNSNKNNINFSNINNEMNHKAFSVHSNYQKDKLNNSFKKNNRINNSQDPLKKPTNKTLMSKINNPKNTQIHLENKQNFIRNNYPINPILKPNNNKKGETIAINKTYSSFPKINKDLTGNKVIQNNNCIDLNNIFGKTLNSIFWNNQENMTLSPYPKKPKKILLTNPDNIPPNNISLIWKKIKNFNKNNSNLSQSEKNMEIKKIEQFYNSVNNNNNYYFSNRLNKNDDEKFIISKKKINKNP